MKRVIRDCLICKRVQGKSFGVQPVADLPEFRVKQAAPFTKVGIDFAGPLFVKEREEMSKCYITVFSCCISRRIHLELVPDLNTATFLNCFRRFTSRRGTPSLIITENAKTFKAADMFLGKLYEDQKVREYISRKRIQWRYILAISPWVGGFYEGMVGTVKRCLRKVLGSGRLTYELQPILVEIEATLNSRPIIYEYDEVGYEFLTPAHLIYGRRLTILPEVTSEEDINDTKFLAKLRYLSSKKEHF